MSTYDTMNAFALSWMLLVMTGFFVAVMVWVLRPGSRKVHEDAAQIIFRHEKNPGPQPGQSKEA